MQEVIDGKTFPIIRNTIWTFIFTYLSLWGTETSQQLWTEVLGDLGDLELDSDIAMSNTDNNNAVNAVPRELW